MSAAPNGLLSSIHSPQDLRGLTPDQLGRMAFHSDSGTAFVGWADFANDLDAVVAPVPEPSTWSATALAFGALAFTWLRRMRKTRGSETLSAG